MDIPVPEKPEAENKEKVDVTVASSAKPDPKPAPTTSDPKPADAPSTMDEKNKRIVELVTSKKYVLAIKEKRSSPLITLGFNKTRDRKNRKGTRKTTKTKTTQVSKGGGSVGSYVKVGIVVLLFAGAYLAVDAGLIDIGWQPPISFVGQDT